MPKHRFRTFGGALRWRKTHPRDRISNVTVTSTAPPPAYTKRQYVLRLCHWGIAHQGAIHYAQTRPIPLRPAHILPRLPLRTDCSGWATICYRYAGAADPNGLGYSGQGYTGSLLRHMRHINRLAIRQGDLVVYGCKSNPTGHHVAVIMSVGERTPETIITCSHGSEAGPLEISVAHEAALQPDGLTGIVYLSSIAFA